VTLAARAEPEVALRLLHLADEAELWSFLREDVWNGVYLLGMLHTYGIASPRSRFTGAFLRDRLVGVLGEAREVHCWYASVAGREAAVAGALSRALRTPAVEVILGPEDLVDALLRALPPPAARRTTRMVLCVSRDGMSLPRLTRPVRLATLSDLLGLVDLYEGYEFDGYPTRRHLRRALAEHIRRGGVYLIELDGRPVAARRIEASCPDVVLFGGLTVDPAYRGRDLGRDVRLGSSLDLLERGIPHCSLRDSANPHLAGHELHEHSPWLVANLTAPRPTAWTELVRRARARISPWDRPCRRRPTSYAPSVRA
jgi:hypothetical protein